LRSTPKGYTTCKKAVVTACCPVDNLLIWIEHALHGRPIYAVYSNVPSIYS
jgi:hypothetical protein